MRAQEYYEVIFAQQRVPAAAWRSAELVARLRKLEPGRIFAPSDDSFRLVPRVLALALEGDETLARKALLLLRERLADEPAKAAHAMLFLGDLDLRAGRLAEAEQHYWSAAVAVLMGDYRPYGREPSNELGWAALRGIECAALQDDWLTARRRLGMFELIQLGSMAQYTNQALRDRVREEFPKWLERCTDPQEQRSGVRRQLAARPFTDGVIKQVGNLRTHVASQAALTEVQLLLTNGDVMTAAVPTGTALDPATFIGHGRIDRFDGGIAWGVLDKGRLREGIALTARGKFDVVDAFVAQNSGPLTGDAVRTSSSIQRNALRIFSTAYDGDRIALDYFDRTSGRHMQLRWWDLSMVSVVNEPMKAMSDQKREEDLAANERYRKFGHQETEHEAELRQWRERTGARAFEYNVDPETQACIKCRGVGQIYRGGYVQQNVSGWQSGLNASDSREVVGTLHRSGGMDVCSWCNGTGRR
ncbi:MAG: hypothetical protein ABL997_13930 [Planctomycetota bacterium]